MKLKPLIILLVIGFLIIFSAAWYGNAKENRSTNNQHTQNNGQIPKDISSKTPSTITTQTPTPQTPKNVSRIDLGMHNNSQSCWVGFQNKVYDVTSWLPRHPGSAQAILPYCGTAEEFEQAFIQKHGTKKVGLLMKVGVLIGDFIPQGNLEQKTK